MDELERRLKRDAGCIDATVSDELDRRIAASLQAVDAEHALRRRPPLTPSRLWWLSSLTGVAAALVVLAIVVLRPAADVERSAVVRLQPTDRAAAETPIVHWKAEPAMLTRPLEQELSDLKADLEKAEQKIRGDIGL